MGLSNDERGWVMTCLSGVACVFGASVICVDILIRQLPGKKDFRIQDSDTFLSASLSLSFGVMSFSALYSMLPSSKSSLVDSGFSTRAATWIMMGCFLGGVFGIQIISRVAHHFMPSHVVDCEHSHDDEPKGRSRNESQTPPEDGARNEDEQASDLPGTVRRRSSLPGHMFGPSSGRRYQSRQSSYFGPIESSTASRPATPAGSGTLDRRPSLHQRVTNTLSSLTRSTKSQCDSSGPCHGYSDPCGQDCFKAINARGGYRAPARMSSTASKPVLTKSATYSSTAPIDESTPLLPKISEEARSQTETESTSRTPTRYLTARSTFNPASSDQPADSSNSSATLDPEATNDNDDPSTPNSNNPEVHHHHVPTNAFLSIGLQTSLAIALHKLPEGFITYATNHANPSLGISVFLALFIHNITEGFAMALPLYLAINSRLKAMAISFVLGGLSQPLGAAVAAVWFHFAGKGKWAPSEGVYGGMFAVTAGIMASVALQLFSEALDLTHSRTLCLVGAFAGMAVMGVSSALTA